MKKGYKRLQFDFSEEAIDRLKQIAQITESRTNAEVVRRSLKFYEYVVQKMKEGYNLEFEKDGEKLIIPPAIF